MGRTVPDWAKVGTEVIESFGRWGDRYGRTLKITAILGNGNARVDGSKSQWRIHDAYSGGEEGYLSEAGGGYGRTTLRHLTSAMKANVAAAKKLAVATNRVRVEAERLEKLARSGDSDAIIAAAASIASAQHEGHGETETQP